MAAGTILKALVLVVVSVLIFGFCSSTAVHNQIWDNVKSVLDELDPDGDDDEGGDTFQEYPLSVSYNLTQTITITPTGTVEYFYYRTPIPADSWTHLGVQSVSDVGVIDDSGFTVDTASLPGWVNLSYDSDFSVPFSFSIYSNFTSEFAVWNLTPAQSGTLADIPQWYNDTYVKDQEWMISGSTVGINLSASAPAAAEAFNTTEDDVLTILHDAYLWVVENIGYHTVAGGDLKSVSQTINDGYGDCDDMSTLLISMARYAGVPAWLEQGVLYNPTTGGWEHHAWVQAFVPLENGSHVNITIDPTNQQFALFSPDKLIVYTDFSGDAQLMEEYYNFMGFVVSPGGQVSVQVSLEHSYLNSVGTVQVPISHSTW
ncbi:MAG: transglutaminase family protein [Candidatus Methanomethylophilaceae archaeon]